MPSTARKTSPQVQSNKAGIAPRDTGKLAEGLSQALADSFSLYVKTLGVHWNVVGPNFCGLHKLTEAQYEDLEDAIDGLAERIRALGRPAPAGFGEFREAGIVDAEIGPGTAEKMIAALIADNEAVARRMRDFSDVAAEARDKFSEDMLIARMGRHGENVWMLRALIAR
ncbi:MAG: Dps family protein [Alphaproteobacteria bacterium]